MGTTMLDIQDPAATHTTIRAARDILAAALARCVSVTPGKSTIPALSSVLVEALPTEGKVRLTVTDLDRWLTTHVPAAITEPVTLLLPAKVLADVVRAFPPGEVTITAPV